MAPAEADPLGRRRHARYLTGGWPAQCSDGQGFRWDAWAVDYSAGGLGLENCPPLDIDQMIDVELKDLGIIPCRVAWFENGKCGVQFVPDKPDHWDDSVSALAGFLAVENAKPPMSASNATQGRAERKPQPSWLGRLFQSASG